MKRAGLIKKFAPVFNEELEDSPGIRAFVSMRASSSAVESTVKELAALKEINGLFITTGNESILARVSTKNARALQDFLTSKALKNTGVEITGTQIVTQTVKDESPVPLADVANLNLKCDLCKADIASSRPYTIKVASTRYYFCCKTCRRAYLEKNGQRIKLLNQRLQS